MTSYATKPNEPCLNLITIEPSTNPGYRMWVEVVGEENISRVINAMEGRDALSEEELYGKGGGDPMKWMD